MLENMVSLCYKEERESPSKEEAIGILSNPFGTKTSYLPTILDGENKLCDSKPGSITSIGGSVVKCDETLTEYFPGLLVCQLWKLFWRLKCSNSIIHLILFLHHFHLVMTIDNAFEKHFPSGLYIQPLHLMMRRVQLKLL